MSNGRRFRHYSRSPHPDPLAVYAAALRAKGQDEREVARAVFYVERYGFEAMAAPDGSDRCIGFAEPTCGSGWDCMNPEHQRLEYLA